MKALMAVQQGVLGIRDIPVPEPGDFDALVQMEACAICNSTDYKLMTNEFFPGVFPVVLGHEVIGRVVKVGSKVENFKAGDRVFRQRLQDRHVPGGRSCWGGFAEFGLATDVWAEKGLPYGPESQPHDQQKLLIDIEPALAAGMITMMETLDCITTCGAGPGKSVAIVGSGPVGQAFALFAKLLGAGPVFAFGRKPGPGARFAGIAKADGYVVGAQFPAEVQRIVSTGGFNLVMEAVGSPDALDTCLRLAGAAGTVCGYGVPTQSNPYRADQKQPNVKSVGAVEGRVQKKLVDYVRAGKVSLSDWVSHRMAFTEFQQAFDLVHNRQALKAVLMAPGK